MHTRLINQPPRVIVQTKPIKMQNTLKPIPRGLTKKKAYEIFTHLSRRHVKKTIHWIQVECEQNPEIKPEEAKRRHNLNAKEVFRLFEELGSPNGYEPLL